jgi:hypothetical protein
MISFLKLLSSVLQLVALEMQLIHDTAVNEIIPSRIIAGEYKEESGDDILRIGLHPDGTALSDVFVYHFTDSDAVNVAAVKKSVALTLLLPWLPYQ